jgi:hypothetical protein
MPTRTPLLLAALCAASLASASDAHALDVPNIYVAHATTTKAFKTDFSDGYADSRGFVGNFAKTQHLSVELAQLANQQQSGLPKHLWGLGFVLRRAISENTGLLNLVDAQAFVAQDMLGRVLVVGIRGTKGEIDELQNNLLAPTLTTAGATYHQSFYRHADTLYDEIYDAVIDHCERGGQVWLTGHSLGGAAATIVAELLEGDGCRVSGVATFGSPRAGLADWQRLYRRRGTTSWDLWYRTQRWVHEDDAVYCLPAGGAWRHVGLESFIDGSKLHVAQDVMGSVCDTPEGFLVWLSGALAAPNLVLDGAMRDFVEGGLKFVFQCEAGLGWDDLWSLGACGLIETTGRLRSVYGMTPDEFFEAAVRFANGGGDEHRLKHYKDALGDVNFDDASSRPVRPRHARANLNLTTAFTSVVVREGIAGTGCFAQPNTSARCTLGVPFGSRVTLQADGAAIVQWGGACAGATGYTCTLTFDRTHDISVSATGVQ